MWDVDGAGRCYDSFCYGKVVSGCGWNVSSAKCELYDGIVAASGNGKYGAKCSLSVAGGADEGSVRT